ncbi:MAG: phosphatase PAP2-related protein [Patescibacteria group bacterium]
MNRIKQFCNHWYRQWNELLKDRKFLISLFSGLTLFVVALLINYQAVLYTERVPVLSVGDLILDNIRTYDLLFMYTYGIFLVVAIIIIYPIFFRPDLLPFTAKTASAFIIIRAFFISLTHIGAPENFFRLPQLADQPGYLKLFYLNDLFFSGHTGFPFLASLLFWENKYLRYFFLFMSVAQGITVLAMHVHYSIDVFSAYFITYTIYVVSDKLFNKLNLSFRGIIEKLKGEPNV